jgi:pimeloyl-ACP methyl ester carboxylesterase
MRVRKHGTAGPLVIVLHGGPAAAGEAAPVARGLADSFRVLEPWQRGSGEEPLTVARHVEDLHALVAGLALESGGQEGVRPALVGESWGAMLALAYAAAYPDEVGPIVLVGCGTFDTTARERLVETLEERTDEDLRGRLEQLPKLFPDEEERLRKRYELTSHLYDFDVEEPAGGGEDLPDDEVPPFDVEAHRETWHDMVRLQEEGVYPAAFAAIESPVLMIHGAYDPHPGRMIRAGLEPHIGRLEYHELERCGHSPWREKHARDEFFASLRDWLARHTESEHQDPV